MCMYMFMYIYIYNMSCVKSYLMYGRTTIVIVQYYDCTTTVLRLALSCTTIWLTIFGSNLNTNQFDQYFDSTYSRIQRREGFWIRPDKPGSETDAGMGRPFCEKNVEDNT